MSLRKLFFATGVLCAGLATLPVSASASVFYTLSGSADLQSFENSPSGPDVRTINFVVAVPNFITATAGSLVLNSCSISGVGFGCIDASFLVYPPTVAPPTTGADFIQLGITTPTGTAGINFVFDASSFGALGTYSTSAGPTSIFVSQILDPVGIGSAGPARLVVSDVQPTPIPGALPLFASGLGALAIAGRRRKRAAAAKTAS
jgi:hypothetical protein